MRDSRESSVSDEDLMTPGIFYKLGGEDDPCFGKLYDLREDECQLCGDIEACAIKFSRNQHSVRKQEEKKAVYKDLDAGFLEKRLEIIKYIETKKAAGKDPSVIKKLVKRKYQLTIKQLKTLI
jgi:hypothetical protein